MQYFVQIALNDNQTSRDDLLFASALKVIIGQKSVSKHQIHT